MVQVGDQAPALGADFSWLWASGPAVIVWMRHFGCQFYPERLTELRDAQSRFHDVGVNIRCVVQGDKTEAKQFCGALGAESLCIADPLRRSYEMMGFERTSWAAILFPSPELKARRREVKAKGFKQDWGNTFRRNGDVLQLPGAALIDQKGVVRWIYRGTNTGDLPPVSTLISVAERAAALAGRN
jgi:hypothetical protein